MPAMLRGPSGHIPLGAAVVTIGRSPDNHLVIPAATVSPHHAEIRSASLGGRRSYSLIDLGSSTGTFLNEQWLAAHVPHLLTTGDRLRLGEMLFLYQESEAVARATPGSALASAGQGSPPGYQVPSPASWPASPSSGQQPPSSFPLPAGRAGLPAAGWLRQARPGWAGCSAAGGAGCGAAGEPAPVGQDAGYLLQRADGRRLSDGVPAALPAFSGGRQQAAVGAAAGAG